MISGAVQRIADRATSKAESHDRQEGRSKMPAVLWALGLVSLICYLAIAWLSRQFGQETLPEDRPTLWVLAWFGLAFALLLGRARAGPAIAGKPAFVGKHISLVGPVSGRAVAFGADSRN